MKRLTLLFGCVMVVLAGVLVTQLLEPKSPLSQPLSLPDGSRVRILSVTYGTNHVVGPPLARFAAQLPPLPQAWLARLCGHRTQALHSTTTPTPTMVVWLEWLTNTAKAAPSSGYFEALLADRSGYIAGDYAHLGGWANPEDLRFRVFPRREAVFTMEFFYHSPTGGVRRCGSLPLANPTPSRFPQWQAEALPASKRAGDVEMTLEQVSTGHGNNLGTVGLPGGRLGYELGTNRLDGHNHTGCLFRLQSLTDTNQVWQVAGEELSDATGNRVSNTGLSWAGTTESCFTFEPSLWTNEAAWKLKCEIKRTQGFAPGETFTFQAVPLGAVGTNSRPSWTTNFGGLTITLKEVARRVPLTNNTWSSSGFSSCSLSVLGGTNGQHLDLLSTRTDNGTNLELSSWGSGGTERTYYFRNIPLEARTADFTFAVQQARWVEFTVKPEVGASRLESKAVGKR